MAEPAPKQEKGWWDKVEDSVSDSYDQQRSLIPKNDYVALAKHDVEVGIMKGVYGGVKSLVTGVIDLAKFADNILKGDPETYKTIWHGAVWIAKETYISYFGTPEQKIEQNERCIAFAKKVYNSIAESVKKDWNEAGNTPGKRTELVSKWVSRAVFEVAALFVGAGEVKAGLKGAELTGEGARLIKAAEGISETTKVETLAETGRVLEKVGTPCHAAANSQEATKVAKAIEKAPKGEELTKLGPTKAVAAAEASEKAKAISQAARAQMKAAKIAEGKDAVEAARDAAGMTKSSFRSVQRISEENDVVIRMRPSNNDCLPWIEKGYRKKPEFLKNKTINKWDVLLGPPPDPESKGLVGCFKPGELDEVKRAEIAKKLGREPTPEEWQKLTDRRKQRLNEFDDTHGEIEEGLKGKAHVDEKTGIVVNDEPGTKGVGQGFTGDHDTFDIQKIGKDGKLENVTPESDPELYNKVVDDLKKDPDLEAQHGAHRAWKYEESDPHYEQKKGIDQTIQNSHKPKEEGGGGESLVTFYPDGSVDQTFF